MPEIQQSTAHRAWQLITQLVVILTNLLLVVYIYIYNLVFHLHSKMWKSGLPQPSL